MGIERLTAEPHQESGLMLGDIAPILYKQEEEALAVEEKDSRSGRAKRLGAAGLLLFTALAQGAMDVGAVGAAESHGGARQHKGQQMHPRRDMHMHRQVAQRYQKAVRIYIQPQRGYTAPSPYYGYSGPGTYQYPNQYPPQPQEAVPQGSVQEEVQPDHLTAKRRDQAQKSALIKKRKADYEEARLRREEARANLKIKKQTAKEESRKEALKAERALTEAKIKHDQATAAETRKTMKTQHELSQDAAEQALRRKPKEVQLGLAEKGGELELKKNEADSKIQQDQKRKEADFVREQRNKLYNEKLRMVKELEEALKIEKTSIWGGTKSAQERLEVLKQEMREIEADLRRGQTDDKNAQEGNLGSKAKREMLDMKLQQLRQFDADLRAAQDDIEREQIMKNREAIKAEVQELQKELEGGSSTGARIM